MNLFMGEKMADITYVTDIINHLPVILYLVKLIYKFLIINIKIRGENKMIDCFTAVPEESQKLYELKKCQESVDKVGIAPHFLRNDVILSLGGRNHIKFTNKTGQILVKNKVNIFDVFMIFRDLKYEYENGMYNSRLYTAEHNRILKEQINKDLEEQKNH